MREIILALFYGTLAVVAAPLLIYAGSAMYDNATRDDSYPYSGFCPDSPTYEEGGEW